MTLAVFILLGVGVLVFGTVQGWDPLQRFWAWLDGFARTPGFGGFAALTAAAVAYLTAAARIRHDRDVERRRIAVERQNESRRRITQERAAERAQRWEMMMWLFSNIDTLDSEYVLRVSSELKRQVESPLEEGLLAAFIQYRLDVPELVPDDGDEQERGEADGAEPAT